MSEIGDRFGEASTVVCVAERHDRARVADRAAQLPRHARALLTELDPPAAEQLRIEHKSRLIAARRMLDRDRAELERRRHSWTWARVGHPPLPIEPLRTGVAAHRLVEKARTWAERGESAH
ncbi:hypothetical protein [Pseudonocardia sp. TRM90224]|uniref:hypothetical protein n=1 Tax=Pseudonocardia sp. TRM90224 TaxID=2812678 RepID=UPI001E56E702|nr:hypothetical protein [Pseudonocardia sp. TRM90224]